MDKFLKEKKIAINFYGLTRSLTKTINSLKQNLFNPLTENSINYDIFIHTYKIHGSYHNVWSGEHTENYSNEDVESVLNPKYFIYDDQSDIIKKLNFESYYSNLGNWTGEGIDENLTKILIKNMCLGLYSKKKITTLFKKYKNDYDYAIIMRPDLLLTSKFDIGFFNEITDKNIIIPEMDSYAGVNDRFCIGKVDTILYYGTLFDHLKDYSLRKSIISERYLLDKLNEKNIEIIKKKISYDMIRI